MYDINFKKKIDPELLMLSRYVSKLPDELADEINTREKRTNTGKLTKEARRYTSRIEKAKKKINSLKTLKKKSEENVNEIKRSYFNFDKLLTINYYINNSLFIVKHFPTKIYKTNWVSIEVVILL